nr:phage holin family protein [Saprospiraceae bacterium]
MSIKDKSDFESLIEHLTNYLNAKFELVKLNAMEVGTNVVSGILKLLVVGALVFTVFIFLGFGVAFWLSELFDNQYSGFFIVGVLFLIIIFLIALLWRSLVKPTVLRIFIQILQDEEN